MAQGQVKRPTKALGNKKSIQQQLAPKRGTRVVKPKNANRIKQQKLLKKHTSGLTAQTERTLAAKAGHLEMLGGGKKDKVAEGKTKKQKKA